MPGHALQSELCYALMGFEGEILRFEEAEEEEEEAHGEREEEFLIRKCFKVAPTVDYLSTSEKVAMEACVVPGAYCASCRALCEAMSLKAESCVSRGAAREAQKTLDDYARDVVLAETELIETYQFVEGPTRLRFLLGHWAQPLRAVEECLRAAHEKRTRGRSLKGGMACDAICAKAATIGAPKAALAARRIANAARRVLLRQLACWCTYGERADPDDEFFVAPVALTENNSIDDEEKDEAQEEDKAWRGAAWLAPENDDAEKSTTFEDLRPLELRRALIPTCLLSGESAEKVLFIGGTLRVLAAADQEEGGVDYAPTKDDVAIWGQRWLGCVRRFECLIENAADAAANEVGAIDDVRQLISDVHDFASKKLLAVLEARSFRSALDALAGVALLRCAPLWHRALELARPTLAVAPKDDEGALVVQWALEEAAKELANPNNLSDRALALQRHRGSKTENVASISSAVDAILSYDSDREDRRHRISVVVDPIAFDWFKRARTNAEVKARYTISGPSRWLGSKTLELGWRKRFKSSPLKEEEEEGYDDDDFDESSVDVEARLGATTPRRIARCGWRCLLAIASPFAIGGQKESRRRVSVSIALDKYGHNKMKKQRRLRFAIEEDDAKRPTLIVADGRAHIASSPLRALEAFPSLVFIVSQRIQSQEATRLEVRCYAATEDLVAEKHLFFTPQQPDLSMKDLGGLSLLVDAASVLGTSLATISVVVPPRSAPVRVQRFAFEEDTAASNKEDAFPARGPSSIAQEAVVSDLTAFRAATGWRDALRIVAEPARPLSDLLFDARTLSAYDACFRRLLAVKRVSLDLDDAWLALAASRVRLRFGDDDDAARRLWTLHFRAAHLVRGVNVWLQRDALESRYADLATALREATHFAPVKKAHARFVVALRQALLVDDTDADKRLDALCASAIRVAAFVKAHAAAPEDAPDSVLGAIAADFRKVTAAIFALPQLRTPLQATADFNGWFSNRYHAPGGGPSSSAAT